MKSFIDYKFLGVHSFVETLSSSGIDYRLFDDDFSTLYEKHSGILNDDDIIRTGLITRAEQGAFFIEFGIKLTKTYSSFIVFIFDHHPLLDEVEEVVLSLEKIIGENIDNVDLSIFADRLSDKS